MPNDLTKMTGAAALIAILAGAPALAQDMTQMDTDQSGTVSEEEFATGYAADASGMETWDTDGSGSVSEDEWATGAASAGSATGNMAWDEQDFASADADRSGDLNPEEFAAVLFLIYDTDQSGDLSADEYSTYSEEQDAMSGDDQG